jgi:manganese/zinc/iron transport system substrate-binding protein
MATTPLVAELCHIVGGEQVAVSSLMGPHDNPHTFRPTFEDIGRLRSAAIIVAVGLGFEAQIEATLRNRAQSRPVIVLGQSLPPSLTAIGGGDPHFWGDVSLWARAAEYLAAELGNLDYRNRQRYVERGEEYRRRLERLHNEVQERLREVPAERRVLITPHQAWGFFGAAYGWTNHGYWGADLRRNSDEAGEQQQAAALVAKVKKRKTTLFFDEANQPDELRSSLEAALRGSEVTIHRGGTLSLDTLGKPGSSIASYEGLMRRNVETIITASSQR